VRVTNLLGNTTVINNAITVNNVAVAVGLPSVDGVAITGGNVICNYRVGISDGTGAGIASVIQDGATVASNLPGASTLPLSTFLVGSLNNCMPVTFTATDNLGNSATRSFGVRFPTLTACTVGSEC